MAAGSTLRAAAEAQGKYFGTEVTGNMINNSTITNLAGQQFDMVTPGNEMKWDTTEPSNGSYNFGPGDGIVSFAKAHGMRVRGHNLVWQNQLPSWVSGLPLNQVQQAMESHITTEVSHYKGEIYAWDVVNEPFNGDGSLVNDVFYQAMGSGYIADALRTAHAADPSAQLYLNDYSIEGENAKSNAMYSLVQSLLAQGVPINGVGFESHYIVGQVPSSLLANMQRFAALGVNVAVTELDDRIQLPASSASLNQQATDYATVVRDCLQVSRCVGVSQWGVGDADSWIPGTFPGWGAATMYDQNYQPKPAYSAALSALGGSGGGGGGGGGGGEIHAVGGGQVPGRARPQHHRGHPAGHLELQRRHQPDLDAHLREPADRLQRQQPDVPGRLQQPDHPRHQGGHLAVQRRREPAMERQRGRHDHRCPVRAVPGRDRRKYRQRCAGRAMDLQRPIQPAMDPRMRKAESMMTVQSRLRRTGRALLVAAAGTALAAGALVASTAPQARAAAQGPCDIYASGGTPCVAAHSTTRALYAAYDGPLYQVRRSSDSTTANISPLAVGGVANAATQNSFCAGTSCVITEIYDQSGNGNNLTDAPGGGAAGGPDGLANATAAPVTVGGQPAYGVYIGQGDGYRDDNTKNIATGNNPEGIYDVVDGTHFNGGCCFDYGNAETNNDDDGAGTMEAVYFGNIRVWGYGTGNGPWIMGDLENGLYSGSNAGYNANDPTTSYRFTTAMVEGGSANQWAILGGNAQSGGLATDFSGTRPSGYYPMKKQGAIILGTGGDNSDGAVGTWYEGVMTSGEPSAATESAVQANIVAAGVLSLLKHRRRGDRADHVGRQ